MPVGLKDLIDTAGIPTTCGSRLLANRVPRRDAESWRRMRKAGATLLGKLRGPGLATRPGGAGLSGWPVHQNPVAQKPVAQKLCPGGSRAAMSFAA